MKLRKSVAILGLAGAVAALVVAGTAFAQTPTPTPNQQAKNSYHELFLDKLASALGTTRDKLNAAFTQARNETVDQQVQDGRLTQEQADRIKSQQGVGPFGFGFRGFGEGGKRGGGPFVGDTQVRDAIAGALGITSEDLATQLRSGKTLAELAKGKEQAVKDALVAAEKARLDQAVKDGKITQDQANQRLEQIRNSDLSNLGGHPGMGRGGPRGNGTQNQAPGTRPSLAPARSGASAL